MKRPRLPALLLNGALLLCSVATILPFLWMLASSLKSNREISALTQTFLPQAPRWPTTPRLCRR